MQIIFWYNSATYTGNIDVSCVLEFLMSKKVLIVFCRVVLDRGFSPWDEELEKVDLLSGQTFSGRVGDYITYIRERKM
jgi:hypothetical protein